MAYVTSWLIGSVADLSDQEFDVNGSGVTLDGGSFYLRDSNTSLSLLDKVAAALTAAGVPGVSVFLTKSRHVRVTASAVFTLVWGVAEPLRRLLGFGGDLAGASSYQAASVSPILWSPAKPESSTKAPWNIRGHKVHTTIQSVAPYSGKTESVSHGYREYNEWYWRNVAMDRVWTSNERGGEWVRWFAECAVTSSRFKLYSQVSEEATTSAEPVVYAYAGLGPYVYSATRKGVNWAYVRSKGLEFTDRRADIEVSAHVVEEYQS